jgi:molecular chaperone GrpE
VNKHKPHHHEPEGTRQQPVADAEKSQTLDSNAKAPAGNAATIEEIQAKLANMGSTLEAINELTTNIQKLQAELAAAKDRELRVHAELDNYRKRAARELDERLRYANLPLLRDLLPVIDNVQRAIEAAEKNADAAALLEGFRMVNQQLDDVLSRHHCTRIEALHAPFDPNVHHAVMQQPSEEHPANTVLTVTQHGYQLHDRVVRPSQVIVSTTK